MRRIISPLIVVAAGLTAVTLLAVGSAAADDSSSFTSQSVPASMGAGARVSVSLTFRNTGTTSWTISGGYVLGSPDPDNGATWQVSAVGLQSTVEAGSSVTFSFGVRAPSTPGTYAFQWQLEHGTTFFGARSTNVAVKVVAPPNASITSPTNRATFAAPA
jgi:Ig-like domain from next to BRCA1 gene